MDDKKDQDVTRRTFLEGAAGAAALTSVFPMLSSVLSSGEAGAGPLAGAKVISSNERNLAYGKETEVEVEYTGANGHVDKSKIYDLQINTENGYVHIIHRFSARHGSMTAVIKGVRGAVSGDKRTDTVESTMFSADGTVHKLPPRQVQVNLSNPYEGLSPDETLQRILKERGMM